MPELPEVETVRRDLLRLVRGSKVTRAQCLDARMLVGGTTPTRLRRALAGAAITDVARVGKVLILRFSSGFSLLVHFRMTGRMFPLDADAPLPPEARTVLHLDDGRRLIHADVRRLGTVELLRTDREATARTLAQIGPDALDNPCCPEELLAALAPRTCCIKGLLLNQAVMSGIGNIYACEILARARVAPDMPCNELTAEQTGALVQAIQDVLAEAILLRGTTISDYRTGTGEEGGFQRSLHVYGREGEACRREGCDGVILRVVQAQRSTYFCPVCQQSAS
jgi:formamidopyrimidine-DNA glycosylase